jgi:hypothetical protein
MTELHWKIGREGRVWSKAEAIAKLDVLPGKLDMILGKLCLDEAQRLVLLAALLENIGLDMAVRLADAELWSQAVTARLTEAPSSSENISGSISDTLVAATTALKAASEVFDRPRQPVPRRPWNYRAIATSSPESNRMTSIHDVHYEYGQPIAYSENPAVILWDEADGLIGAFRCIERMKEALLKPILNAADFAAQRPTRPAIDS